MRCPLPAAGRPASALQQAVPSSGSAPLTIRAWDPVAGLWGVRQTRRLLRRYHHGPPEAAVRHRGLHQHRELRPLVQHAPLRPGHSRRGQCPRCGGRHPAGEQHRGGVDGAGAALRAGRAEGAGMPWRRRRRWWARRALRPSSMRADALLEPAALPPAGARDRRGGPAAELQSLEAQHQVRLQPVGLRPTVPLRLYVCGPADLPPGAPRGAAG